MKTVPWTAIWSVGVCILGIVAIVGGLGSAGKPAGIAPVEDPGKDLLEADHRALLIRIGAKRQAASEVLAGYLTLVEAAERTRRLRDEVRQRFHISADQIPPHPFEEEDLCREVIAYVEEALRDQPGRAREVLPQLKQELREHLAGGGLTLKCGDDGALE